MATIFGTAGRDTLVGEAGDVTIEGGGGGDYIYVWGSSDLSYRHLVVHEIGSGNVLIFDTPAPVAGLGQLRTSIDIGSGVASAEVVSGDSNQHIADIVFTGINNVRGSPGADFITGSEGADTIDTGVGGLDIVRGYAGDDLIELSQYADHGEANGNTGDDTLSGGGEFSTLYGGQGNDRISAFGPSATANGNKGDDVLVGSIFSGDSLYGGQGDDSIEGGPRKDWISGDLGHNTLAGAGGADTFHASAGDDVVRDFSIADGDRVQIDAGLTYDPRQIGPDVEVTLSNSGHMTLQNVQLSSLPAGWIFSA